ncbi:permease prefix domain 1-containing protein [Sporolactobacillus pectinivorans]|uniref:permease prefix domain 1-containing protein n=1 Tax=Sporolactobacillus pectinivorans TaxID=1591408 RepID=UPI000C258EFE|nr:permease prefix domain 1-containing protein [Sporolactobacillus pectinivorans]
MKRLNAYIDKAFENIPKSEQADQAKEEIIRDLEEKVADLMEEGKSQEDAINKAIVEFGDIDEIKQELDLPDHPSRRKQELARLNLGFSIWGSILVITLSVFINFYYSPHIIWFIYPTFGIAWWPLSMFYNWYRKKVEDQS